MNRTLKTEAIVLRKRSLPNQDKIITLFTLETGKVTAFAKGIKKITSRRLPHIQTANLIQTILYKKQDRFYLQESQLISGFSAIKNDRIKLQDLYVILFILERMLPENQKETSVYVLLKKFFIELSKSEGPTDMLLNEYLNKLMRILGYSVEEKSFEDMKRSIESIIHEKIPDLHL